MNTRTQNKHLVKGTLGTTPFNIIQQSDILVKEDFDKLIPLTQELQETFKKSQSFRTRTEMEVSVLNDIKFPTHASKYWQATREQNVMFQELVMLSYEYRKNMIEIKILQRRLESESDDLERELIRIDIDKKIFISKQQEKVAKNRIREIKAWSEIKEREAQHMSEKELAEVDNHQLISYTKRWINQSMIMGANGSPAERQNLFGQLESGILACAKAGVLDEALKDFSPSIQNQIKTKYNL